jgi:hypothetical protein
MCSQSLLSDSIDRRRNAVVDVVVGVLFCACTARATSKELVGASCSEEGPHQYTKLTTDTKGNGGEECRSETWLLAKGGEVWLPQRRDWKGALWTAKR